MLDRILDQRLQSQRRNFYVLQGFRDGDFIANALAEASFLNLKIVANDLEFQSQRDQAALVGV